ncbi:MAG: hypothetical protein KAS04_03830 [Candidatus Aenigmarchaeota archaeon]|nr:hypothetical protein [Candidatus Aenigmarchaeota archaeon]
MEYVHNFKVGNIHARPIGRMVNEIGDIYRNLPGIKIDFRNEHETLTGANFPNLFYGHKFREGSDAKMVAEGDFGIEILKNADESVARYISKD